MDGQPQDNAHASDTVKINKSSNDGMISGLSFAAMIIIGGILGDYIFYTLMYSIFPFTAVITLLIGLILLIISGFYMRKVSEASIMTYILIFLECMTIPLLGGIMIYAIARNYHLTL